MRPWAAAWQQYDFSGSWLCSTSITSLLHSFLLPLGLDNGACPWQCTRNGSHILNDLQHVPLQAQGLVAASGFPAHFMLLQYHVCVVQYWATYGQQLRQSYFCCWAAMCCTGQQYGYPEPPPYSTVLGCFRAAIRCYWAAICSSFRLYYPAYLTWLVTASIPILLTLPVCECVIIYLHDFALCFTLTQLS